MPALAEPLAEQIAALREDGVEPLREPQLEAVEALVERAGSAAPGVQRRLLARATERLATLEDALARDRERARTALAALGASPRQCDRALARLGPAAAERAARRRWRRRRTRPGRDHYRAAAHDLAAVLGLARARAHPPADPGRYNAALLATGALEEAAALSPVYLRALCGRIDDWAALMSLPEPARSRPS